MALPTELRKRRSRVRRVAATAADADEQHVADTGADLGAAGLAGVDVHLGTAVLEAEGIRTNVTLIFSATQALAAAKAGASYITFHPEASEHPDRSLQLVRDLGCKAGLVFNPGTPLHWLDYLADKVDMILIMSVNPGFGGQRFIPSALRKIDAARRFIDDNGLSIRLEVDGGVKIDNIAEVARAGADTFVAGSAIFGSADYASTITAMRRELAGVDAEAD